MNIIIKDIRKQTGMSQKQFAETYGIPISTLRKWEQGEASPPQYVLRLLARAVALADGASRRIEGINGEPFAYDKDRGLVMDAKGNSIYISEDLQDVDKDNLRIYVTKLFSDFYAIRDKFERDCRYDKKEKIKWM